MPALKKISAGGAGFVSNFLCCGVKAATSIVRPTANHCCTCGALELREEQFYIFWPVTVWLAWKRKWNFISVAVAILLLSFVLNIAFVQTYPVATFYSPGDKNVGAAVGGRSWCDWSTIG